MPCLDGLRYKEMLLHQDDLDTCVDRRLILDSIGDQAGDRKLRLFLVACCRRIWPLLHDERCRHAVQVAERFADGLADAAQLAAAHEAAKAARDARAPGAPVNATYPFLEPSRGKLGYDREHPVMLDVHEGASRAASGMANYRGRMEGSVWSGTLREEIAWQCGVLRDMFGYLYHSVAIEPAWRSREVLSLAQAAYFERGLLTGELDGKRLAVLADVLEKTSPKSREVVAHLRAPGPHVRGCWALDLVLASGGQKTQS
jgi:hypothetical protein